MAGVEVMYAGVGIGIRNLLPVPADKRKEGGGLNLHMGHKVVVLHNKGGSALCYGFLCLVAYPFEQLRAHAAVRNVLRFLCAVIHGINGGINHYELKGISQVCGI